MFGSKWKELYLDAAAHVAALEALLGHVRKQRNAQVAKVMALQHEIAELKRPMRDAAVSIGPCRAKFAPVHRENCPLSYQLTEKVKRQYDVTTIGQFLDVGWTLEALKQYGFIEPKVNQ